MEHNGELLSSENKTFIKTNLKKKEEDNILLPSIFAHYITDLTFIFYVDFRI